MVTSFMSEKALEPEVTS